MRYVVVGTSGSGKSTFAKALAEKLHCPHTELDELFWGPNWQIKPETKFKTLVEAAVVGERWVIDGNYNEVRTALWSRATHIIWMHYPFPLVMWRVIRRTFTRLLSRHPIWHNNKESFIRTFLSKESIILWTATTHGKNLRKYAALQQQMQTDLPHLQWLEFKHPSEAKAFLANQ